MVIGELKSRKTMGVILDESGQTVSDAYLRSEGALLLGTMAFCLTSRILLMPFREGLIGVVRMTLNACLS